MARTEEDKEDLIVEGVAMVERAEFARVDAGRQPSEWQILTVGFRRNNCFSVYFDQTFFYQFDAEGGLRRAHVDGLLYRSQSHTLAEIRRKRTTDQTTLERHDLSDDELQRFRYRMMELLQQVVTLFETEALDCQRSVPEDFDIRDRTDKALKLILNRQTDFLSAAINARG